MSGAWPRVSVVMAVRNEERFIARSLAAVLAQDYPPERLEVIVADGMSTDGTRALVAAAEARCAQLRLLDNPGRIVATGLNRALVAASGEVVVRVDGHCEIAADYVRCCVEELARCRAEGTPAGGVGGPLETIGESAVARAVALAMSSRFGVGGSTFRVGSAHACWVDTVAFPAYPRATLERVGLLDEELVRNQDDEYNYRLRHLGGRLLLSPRVRARYFSRSTLGSLARQYFQYGWWKVRVLQKHARQMQPRQFAPPLLVAALLAALAVSPWSAGGRLLLAVLAAGYGGANLGASLWTAARARAWALLPLLPPAFAALHLGYGAGFLAGLVRFAHRWGDRAGRVPPWPAAAEPGR